MQKKQCQVSNRNQKLFLLRNYHNKVRTTPLHHSHPPPPRPRTKCNHPQKKVAIV